MTAISGKLLMAIAAGGAIGAVMRFLTINWALKLFGPDFPHGTLMVNVVGSLMMGILVELMVISWTPSPEMRALLIVGLLGSLTTFSSFSLDIYSLVERDELMTAAIYMVVSVVLSITALFIGVQVVRVLLRATGSGG